jgi:hypothetical protein
MGRFLAALPPNLRPRLILGQRPRRPQHLILGAAHVIKNGVDRTQPGGDVLAQQTRFLHHPKRGQRVLVVQRRFVDGKLCRGQIFALLGRRPRKPRQRLDDAPDRY